MYYDLGPPDPLHFVCGWCAHILSLLTWPLSLDPSLAWVVLAADPGGSWTPPPLPVLFGPALGDTGRPLVLCPLSLAVLLEALLRVWLACHSYDVPWGHHFLIICITV